MEINQFAFVELAYLVVQCINESVNLQISLNLCLLLWNEVTDQAYIEIFRNELWDEVHISALFINVQGAILRRKPTLF